MNELTKFSKKLIADRADEAQKAENNMKEINAAENAAYWQGYKDAMKEIKAHLQSMGHSFKDLDE